MQQLIMSVPLTLTPDEFLALTQGANKEMRRPRDHARYLLREALGLTDNNVQSVEIANRDALDSDPRRATAA